MSAILYATRASAPLAETPERVYRFSNMVDYNNGQKVISTLTGTLLHNVTFPSSHRMTCFGPWDTNKHNGSRDLKGAGTVSLPSLAALCEAAVTV